MAEEGITTCYERAPKPAINIEHTLVIIKPDAMNKADEIVHILLKSGFTIINQRRVLLTAEAASEVYEQHMLKLFFPTLLQYISSGPVLVLQLAREKAVSYLQEICGPTNPLRARITHPNCLRALYGIDVRHNGVHCSGSCDEAQQEIRFFFHDSHRIRSRSRLRRAVALKFVRRLVVAALEPILEGDRAKDYFATHVNPTLLQGLSALSRHKPADPIKWLADWLVENNPNKSKLHDWMGHSILPPP